MNSQNTPHTCELWYVFAEIFTEKVPQDVKSALYDHCKTKQNNTVCMFFDIVYLCNFLHWQYCRAPYTWVAISCIQCLIFLFIFAVFTSVPELQTTQIPLITRNEGLWLYRLLIGGKITGVVTRGFPIRFSRDNRSLAWHGLLWFIIYVITWPICMKKNTYMYIRI